MIEFPERFTLQDQIDWLARFVIIQSIIYYDMDRNFFSDKEYDAIAYHLADLVRENPEVVKKCYYYEALKDFDGTTGFYLKDRLTPGHKEYLEHLASIVVYKSVHKSYNTTLKNA